MKPLEAVIFDWAGTTVDFGCMAPVHAMKAAFAQQNLVVSLEEIRKPMGLLKADHIKAVLAMNTVREGFIQNHGREPTANDAETIYTFFETAILSTLDQHTKVIEGVIAVQDYLRDQHIKIGTTTGYTKTMVAIVTQSARAQGYEPDFVIASDEVKRGRPYPYMLHQNFLALDVQDTRSVIKVGDTLVDILEGLHAGCWSVGITKSSSMLGLNEREAALLDPRVLKEKMDNVRDQMLAAGAHYVIDTLAELPSTIQRIQHNR